MMLVVVTSAAQKVLEAALALRSDEREELVGELSLSLDPETLGPAWEAEINARLQRIQDGDAAFHDAEDHLRILRTKHGG